PLLFEVGDDLARLATAEGVGLEDREREGASHVPLYGVIVYKRALRRSTKSLGRLATPTPAASNAAIFSAAVPDDPEMIAPACPMRRPGGAVCPAMKPTTGFFMDFWMNDAASCSSVPPISPIM